MLTHYTPRLEDLWFRQMLMADEDTMSYNHAWGGTIPFPESDWKSWYEHWLIKAADERFYRYLLDDADNSFVGEIAYHFDNTENIHIADIIIYSKQRGKGYGTQALSLLCSSAKEHGVKTLYDNIAIDNQAITLFLKAGFTEEYRTEEIIMLKKELQ